MLEIEGLLQFDATVPLSLEFVSDNTGERFLRDALVLREMTSLI